MFIQPNFLPRQFNAATYIQIMEISWLIKWLNSCAMFGIKYEDFLYQSWISFVLELTSLSTLSCFTAIHSMQHISTFLLNTCSNDTRLSVLLI